MKIKLLMDQRVIFAKGSEIEVDEREAERLLSLGFAEKVAEKKAVVETKAEKPKKKKKIPRSRYERKRIFSFGQNSI
jgi:hypothetical protein